VHPILDPSMHVPPPHRLVTGILAVLILVSLLAVSAGPAAARADPGPVTVTLSEDGSATLSVTYRYDLEGDRAQAFEDLQGDTDAQQTTADRFADRVRSIAADLANQTGRTMSVSEARAEVSTENGIGTVTVSVTWDGLVAVDGDRLTLAEPFDAGFESDRPLVVELPEGYTATETIPEPDSTTDGQLHWTAEQSLTDYRVSADPESTPTPTPTPTTAGGPGLGVLAALFALALAALIARR
ncbi:MAG: DUF7345 domain-containing protein, partial [Halococcoides sp.]